MLCDPPLTMVPKDLLVTENEKTEVAMPKAVCLAKIAQRVVAEPVLSHPRLVFRHGDAAILDARMLAEAHATREADGNRFAEEL